MFKSRAEECKSDFEFGKAPAHAKQDWSYLQNNTVSVQSVLGFFSSGQKGFLHQTFTSVSKKMPT